MRGFWLVLIVAALKLLTEIALIYVIARHVR